MKQFLLQFILVAAFATALSAQCTRRPDPRVWAGTYSSGTTYNQCDVVYYSTDSKAYVSLQGSNTGHTPDTSSLYWSVVYAAPVNLQSSDAIQGSYIAFDYNLAWLKTHGSGGVGDTGPKGDKGDTGATGAQGIQGIQGVKGDKGDTGDAGATGAQGIQGVKGDKGDTGDPGATGSQGIQGVKGDKGDTGSAGSTGATGSQGIQGIQGVKGDKGDTGDTGPQGPAGSGGSSIVTTPVSYTATPTFPVSASTEQYFTMTLTGGVTSSTLNTTSATVNQEIIFIIKQNGTGNWPFALPSQVRNACSVSLSANVTTTIRTLWDGTYANTTACGDDDTPTLISGPTRSAPGTPVSGLRLWFDNSANTPQSIDSSGVRSSFVKTASSRTTNQFATHVDPATGQLVTAQPIDADLAFTDVTTNNASSSKHGFLPKLSGNSTDCFHGDGAYGACTSTSADVSSNTSTSVDSEVAVFSSTTGKIIKRATGTGVAHLTSGVLSAGQVQSAEIANNAVDSARLALINRTRTCTIQLGGDDSAALTTVQVQPQKSLCSADVTGTITQILVKADAGATTVQLAYRHSGATTNYTSAVMTPGTVSGIADKVVCSNAAGTAINVDGVSVTCGTLSTQTWTLGDSLETVAGTADGVSKRVAIFVTYTVN
jgi:hypothetical protein